MATQLIRLEDGTLVEAQVPDDQAQQISGGFAKKVDASFERIKPLLLKACKPIAEAWKELNQDMDIDSTEVELGIGFEGEGNLYITKAKTEANLTVKLVLKPKA
ncbi:MAG: CU044_2847 family protein [Cyanobacteria bacterium J06639_16]